MRFLIVLIALAFAGVAQAQTVVTTTVTTFVPAQQAAEQMARRGVLGHCRNAGGQIEGIGFSPVSADAAIRSCCFWGKRKAREIGVARGARGWYAVVRYY